MTLVEAQSELLVPHISKYAITMKPQTKTWKTGKHYTNFGQDDHNMITMKPQTKTWKTSKHYTNFGQDYHNMETCRVNKKEMPIVSTKEATIQLEKG